MNIENNEISFDFLRNSKQVRLSQIASPNARIGWQNLRRSEFKDEGDVYIITGTDFINGTVNLKTCQYVDTPRYEMDDKIKIHENDILITKDGTIGKVAIVKGLDKKATLNAGVFVLNNISKDVDRMYLYHYLRSPNLLNFINSQSTGGTILHLNQSVLLNFPVQLPELHIQQKIAEFFTALDEKLSIVSNVCLSFERLYKSTISDLLAQRIRFKSNDQTYYPEWNHCRLGDIFKVSMCKRVFKDETSAEGDVPFYKIGTLGKEPDSFISKELFEKYVEKYSYPKKGDTLISCSGTVGKCVVFDGKASYYQDSNIIWLEPINTDYSYDKRFLTLVLENYNWGDLSASTIKRIYSSDILEKVFVEPCIDEQRDIADFAFDLKEKIAICNKKLEALKQLKKAFMQRMFV